MAIQNVYALMAGVEKYVVSGAIAGLKNVIWHDGQDAFTDGTTIHLPKPSATMSDADVLLWRYKAEHELGHEDAVNSIPHWKEVMQEKKKLPKYKGDALLWWIANVISDHVQERNRVGHFVGRDEVLLNGRALFLDRMFKEHPYAKNEQEAPSLAIFKWDTHCRKEWNPDVSFPACNSIEQPIFDKLMACGVSFGALKNEEDVFKAACIVRELFPKDSSNGEEDSEEGDGEGDGELTDELPKIAKRITPSSHLDDKGGKLKAAAKSGGFTPRIPVSLKKVRPSAKRYSVRGDIESITHRTNLPAKVRAALMAAKRVSWDAGYKAGKLDTARLHAVLGGREDVFKRRGDVRKVNSAVSLLVDCSGSMSGRRYYGACAAAMMLAESLQGIGVNLEIAGFTEFDSGPDGLIHDIWVPFGTRYAAPRVIDNMELMSANLENNSDGENILYAYNRLLQQDQPNKILVVLSDGTPAAEGPRDARMDVYSFTKQVNATIENDKRVKLIGIGIDGHDGSGLFKNFYKVEYGARLEPTLLSIVRDKVLG